MRDLASFLFAAVLIGGTYHAIASHKWTGVATVICFPPSVLYWSVHQFTCSDGGSNNTAAAGSEQSADSSGANYSTLRVDTGVMLTDKASDEGRLNMEVEFLKIIDRSNALSIPEAWKMGIFLIQGEKVLNSFPPNMPFRLPAETKHNSGPNLPDNLTLQIVVKTRSWYPSTPQDRPAFLTHEQAEEVWKKPPTVILRSSVSQSERSASERPLRILWGDRRTQLTMAVKEPYS